MLVLTSQSKTLQNAYENHEIYKNQNPHWFNFNFFVHVELPLETLDLSKIVIFAFRISWCWHLKSKPCKRLMEFMNSVKIKLNVFKEIDIFRSC